MNNIDIYVYDLFEHTRHHFLSVHDIDLRRWSLKKKVNYGILNIDMEYIVEE